MTAYLIKGTPPSVEVFTFTDPAAANRAAGSRFEGAPTTVVAEESDLASMSGPAIVALHNALAQDDSQVVSRFATRSDGARRTFARLEERFRAQPTESESKNVPAEVINEGEAEVAPKKSKKAAKPKKARAEKVVRAKKAPAEKKGRSYKPEVRSTGGTQSKATALEMIQRKNGATVEEIAERLGLSVGSAKNLVWYLRRDGHKIVAGTKSDAGRKPYVIG